MKKINSILLISIISFVFISNNQASAPQAVQDSLSSEAPQPIETIDVNYEIERAEKKFNDIENSLEPDSRFFEIDSVFPDYKVFLEKEAIEFKSFNPYNLSKYFLESTYRSWEGFSLKLNGWESEINDRIVMVQENIAMIDNTIEVWNLTLESEAFVNEVQELKDRIQEIIDKSKRIRVGIQKQKRQYIILQDKISDVNNFCNDITEEVSTLQQHLRDSTFIAATPPIWKVKVTQSDYSHVNIRLNKARHENAKSIRNYSETESLSTFWIVVVMIIILFVLVRYRYLKIAGNKSEHNAIDWLLKKFPTITIISLLILLFRLLFPYNPLIIGNIVLLSLLIYMRYILAGFVNRRNLIFISKLILLIIINDLEIIFWYFGNIARYLIFFETILGVLLMMNYLKPIQWKQFKTSNQEDKVKWLLALFAFTFYLLSFIANFFGYLNLSVLLAKSGIHVPVSTIIIYGIYKIIVVLVKALIKIGEDGKSKILDKYWKIIEKRAIQIIRIILVYYWFFSISVSFEISRVIFDFIADFFLKERNIGTLNITIGGIFILILILLITYLISRLLKFLIEDVILKHAHLPRGVPAAISVTIRYFLVILGFMFALSAAGIDLGNFGLLAGALGVGIGFGLQNIVNNFISGLILVYERPIQVGDTIEVENLLGQVNRIGIRSSNVRTYDGAEVLVPNGNLISNQLINWTLSDNKRRIEIKVGASYGSDPNVVIKLLEEVALENEVSLKEPAPRALFEEFGDSSLNFRLLFWVPYDVGLGTKSDVSVGVFNKFKENNIEIPFPQVDLNMKEKKK